jgi:hypothetical protein
LGYLFAGMSWFFVRSRKVSLVQQAAKGISSRSIAPSKEEPVPPQ